MAQLLLPRLVQSMVNEVTVRLNLLALFTQPVTVTELLACLQLSLQRCVGTGLSYVRYVDWGTPTKHCDLSAMNSETPMFSAIWPRNDR